MADVWERDREGLSTAYSVDLTRVTRDMESLSDRIGTAPTEVTFGNVTSLAAQAEPLIPDLEEFDFEDLPQDQKVRKRAIEQNLGDAIRFHQEMGAIRREYAEIARTYLEINLRLEEFFRLDAVHRLEENAHLYEIPRDEAKYDLEGVNGSIAWLGDAMGRIERLFSEEIVRFPSTVAAAGKLAKISAPGDGSNKQDAQEAGELIANVNSGLQDGSWNVTRSTIRSNLAEAEAKRSVLEERLKYLEKDIGFRLARTAISRDVAYTNLRENIRPNSPVNYSERLTNLRVHYRAAAARLAGRMAAVSAGAVRLYDIDASIPAIPRGEFFDRSLAWLGGVQEELLRQRRREIVEVHPLWMSSFFGDNTADELETGARITIGTAQLGGKSGLLRGIGFEFSGESDRSISVLVEPPPGAVLDIGALDATPVPSLLFGRVSACRIGSPIQREHINRFWNGVPNGQWRIQVKGGSQAVLRDLVMHVWLSELA